MKQAVVTIASKNYFSHVKTLMRSLKEHKPSWDRYVVLVDQYLDADKEKKLIEDERLYHLVNLCELNIPDLNAMGFQYNILEFNTAVKPWALEHLFRAGYDTAVYLDPDICVYHTMEELDHILQTERDALVLSPHITSPIKGDGVASIELFMKSGVYNLGFVGLTRGRETAALLKWWQSKLKSDCRVDAENGIFVDQKWMDIAPCFCSNTIILRNECYNVAYWNQEITKLEKSGDTYLVNGRPLEFFHFSFTKHLDTRDRVLREIVKKYQSAQVKLGAKEFAELPYYYGLLSDGTKIPDVVRSLYQTDPALRKAFGKEPFKATKNALLKPCNEKAGAGIPVLLMDAVWKLRGDLQAVYPQPYTKDLLGYTYWFIHSGMREYGVSPDIIFEISRKLDEVKNSVLKKQERPVKMIGLKKRMVQQTMAGKNILYKWLPKKAYNSLRKTFYKWFAEVRRESLGLEGYSDVFISEMMENYQVSKVEAFRDQAAKAARKSAARGVNLFVFLHGEFSIAEVGRIMAKTLESARIPFCLIDIGGNQKNVSYLGPWKELVVQKPVYNTNVFVANADSVSTVIAELPTAFFKDRYNISIWNWEMPLFPSKWKTAFDFYHEIWAPSEFTLRSIRGASPIPVKLVPYAIEMDTKKLYTRDYFGIRPGSFVFLCMFDVSSITTRKNPHGAIDAFLKAFGNGTEDVMLVIKINNYTGRRAEVEALNRLALQTNNILIIEKTMKRQEVNSLMDCADVYVSLHRSEGFGLALAESMYLKKPVIATNWSANVDFMNTQNSCPVDYVMTQLGQDYPPYEAHQFWAEPDEYHAALYMQKLYSDRNYYKKIARAGYLTAKSKLSMETCGETVKDILKENELID